MENNKCTTRRSGKYMRPLAGLLLLASVTGCNVTTSELLNTAATTAVAGTAAAIGAPAAVVAGTTAITGITTAVITPEEAGTIDLSEVPEEDRAGVVKYEATLDTVKQIGIIGGIVAIVIFGIGYFLPNRKTREMERILFNDPDHTIDDDGKMT